MPTPDEKKIFVKEKFSAISHKYDFLNSVLSFQIDRYWRWVTTRELKQFPDGAVLDLCAGTLPLSLELTRQAPERQVFAIDPIIGESEFSRCVEMGRRYLPTMRVFGELQLPLASVILAILRMVLKKCTGC
jgi:demethylmenaquinone methyltransferase/2-methoxy-6-polyprenyl-1,4-benzoquinol methylase